MTTSTRVSRIQATLALALCTSAVSASGCLGSPPTAALGGSDATAKEGGGSVDAPADTTLGPGDDAGEEGGDATLGSDGVAEDDGGGDADAATSTGQPEGGPTCLEGGACTPAECQLGATTCSDGGPVCTETQDLTNGAPCDAGADAYAVCSAGQCATCNQGLDCTPANSCQKMTIDCSSGAGVCTAAGQVTNGTSCGTNLYCNDGQCAACTAGAGCAPTGSPCDQGSVSCSGGQATCTDQHTSLANGTSCGTNMVCKAGACVACTAGTACTYSTACHAGVISCSTGSAVCVDNGAAQDGTACTGSNLCLQTYTCKGGTCTGSNAVTCPSSGACYQAPTCNTTSGACSSAQVTNGTACGAAGANMVCENGSCGCPSGDQSCSGTCVNVLGTDAANCGACGRSCGKGGCTAGSCGSWVVASTGGFAGSQHVIATDGTNIVWLDGSNNAKQVPMTGGTIVTLGAWSTDYAVGSIAVAAGVVAWTAFPNPSLFGTGSEPTSGGFYTATEGSAGSAVGLIASDSNFNFYGSGGIGLRSNGGTGYTLINGGSASLVSCTLASFGGTCSNFGPYSGDETGDDLILAGTSLYWTDFGSQSVFSMSTGGGAVTTVASGETGPVLVAVDSTNVYWANNNASGAFGIDKNTQASPNPAGALNVLPLTTGAMTCLATDGTYVYFSGAVGSTKVGYVSIKGAATATQLYPLPNGGAGAASVLYWKGFVYWADVDENTIRAIAAPLAN
jgi:hypothetical protein